MRRALSKSSTYLRRRGVSVPHPLAAAARTARADAGTLAARFAGDAVGASPAQRAAAAAVSAAVRRANARRAESGAVSGGHSVRAALRPRTDVGLRGLATSGGSESVAGSGTAKGGADDAPEVEIKVKGKGKGKGKSKGKTKAATKVVAEAKEVKEAKEAAVEAEEPVSIRNQPSEPATPVVEAKKPFLARMKGHLDHYVLGTKLLSADVRIAAGLLTRVLQGYELSRRERRQLVRTGVDLLRLIPFLFFVIIPFMELLLPVALYIFPNMLPSTFKDDLKEEENLKKRLRVKLEMAKFLQETLKESAVAVRKRSGTGEDVDTTASELVKFIEAVRAGKAVTTDDIVYFSRFFADEVTLDSLHRQQLMAMCELLQLPTFGTDPILRYQLRAAMRKIKADDRDIYFEGVNSLTFKELQAACRERGMRGIGLNKKALRAQLQQWLDLSMDSNVPSTLLILSRALTLQEDIPAEAALAQTLGKLDDDVVGDLALDFPQTAEETESSRRQRQLDILQREQELIDDEREQFQAVREYIAENPPVSDVDAEAAASEEKKGAKKDAAADADTGASSAAGASKEATMRAAAAALEAAAKFGQGKDPIVNINDLPVPEDKELPIVNAEAVLNHERWETVGSVLSMLANADTALESERKEYEVLLKEFEEQLANLRELQAGEGEVSKSDRRLISKLTKMVMSLESELLRVEGKIGDRLKKIDLDNDGKISRDELLEALGTLRDELPENVVEEIIRRCDKDQDGILSISEISETAARESTARDPDLAIEDDKPSAKEEELEAAAEAETKLKTDEEIAAEQAQK